MFALKFKVSNIFIKIYCVPALCKNIDNKNPMTLDSFMMLIFKLKKKSFT